jgi:hypothetical protein
MIIFFLFTPLIFMAFITISLMKRESIKWELNRGNRCWNCKEKKEPNWNIKSGEVNLNLSLCEICERHLKISKIISIRNRLYYGLKKIIISSKSKWIMITILIINLLILLFNFIVPFFLPELKTFAIISFIIVSHLFWVWMYLEHRLTSIKKPSTK